jgi:hypothetical protein
LENDVAMTRHTESAAPTVVVVGGVVGSALLADRYRRVERRHVDLLRVASSLCRIAR